MTTWDQTQWTVWGSFKAKYIIVLVNIILKLTRLFLWDSHTVPCAVLLTISPTLQADCHVTEEMYL